MVRYKAAQGNYITNAKLSYVISLKWSPDGGASQSEDMEGTVTFIFYSALYQFQECILDVILDMYWLS